MSAGGPGAGSAAGRGASTVLVAATANPDKLAEIADILAGAGVAVTSRPPEVGEVVEDGDSLVANARLKARAICVATGSPAVADDTGLEVAALGGAPGIYAARYAGEGATYAANVTKLLAELAALPDRGGPRRARFVTVALVAWPDGSELWRAGAVEGSIADVARGDHGFGYDPVFVPDEGDGRTFGEMTGEEKHSVSHRGRAFRALAAALAAGGEPAGKRRGAAAGA